MELTAVKWLVNCRPETVKDLSKVPQLEVVVLEFEPRQWGPGFCAINHQPVQPLISGEQKDMRHGLVVAPQTIKELSLSHDEE